ncbi:MAG: tRNA (cmo5U34)-methyltransferase [Myxococcota bacterium]|jgi:tRNA (cmo5U34)-methyltransferase
MEYSFAKHLNLEIAEYDRIIREFIPGYEEMLVQAAEAVAAVTPSLVLDLGAGTAALSEQVLARTDDTVVEQWDIDPAMLDQAQPRIERFGPRAVPRVRSYLDPFPACDAIMGSLALHHIPTMEGKRELYARAFEALRSGGALVIADATMPTDEAGKRAGFQHWADHMGRHGIPEKRAFEHFEEWSGEDTYFPLEIEVAALEGVGFGVTVPWRDGPSTVIVASRP